MAEDKAPDARRVTIKNVRLSYPTLRTKRAAVKDGKEKFSASFLMDPKTPEGQTAIKACQAAVAAAEIKEFGEGKAGHIAKVVQDPKRIALKKGEKCMNNEGEVYKGYEGMVALTCSADKRPLLLAKNKTEIDLDDIEDEMYGGVFCDATVAFFCISEKDKGGNGLFCSVEAIRSRETGESFGGGRRATADDFDDLDDDDGISGGTSSSGGGDDDLLGGDDDDLLAT